MGCCSGNMPGGGEFQEIAVEVTEKLVKIEEEFSSVEELKEKDEVLKLRHDALAAADKNNEEGLTKLIKEFNKKELDVDNKLIIKEVNKKVKMYELGLEYSDVLREKLLTKLEKKINGPTASIVKNQIEKIKKLSPAEFLDSEFGKPLKDLLKKKGLTDTAMKDYMDKLMAERAERRKKEREEFGIAVNEYPDEEIYEAAKKDLYNDMLKETADKYMEKIKK